MSSYITGGLFTKWIQVLKFNPFRPFWSIKVDFVEFNDFADFVGHNDTYGNGDPESGSMLRYRGLFVYSCVRPHKHL